MYYINFFFFFGGQLLTGTDSFIITKVFGAWEGWWGCGYPPPHLFRVDWPKWRQGQWQGRSVGWGGGETGYDGGPAAVAAAAAAGRGSLPVISVLSALANLTNYTPPQQPGLSSPPAH